MARSVQRTREASEWVFTPGKLFVGASVIRSQAGPYIARGFYGGKIQMLRFTSYQKLFIGALVASGVGVGYALAAQPHMDAALALLQNARGELVVAAPNKGGHREAAIALVDQAIVQVRQGIAFAATH
jgi:hypothetical protein